MEPQESSQEKKKADDYPYGKRIWAYEVPFPPYQHFLKRTTSCTGCERIACLAGSMGYTKFCCRECYESDGTKHSEACNAGWEEFKPFVVADDFYTYCVECKKANGIGNWEPTASIAWDYTRPYEKCTCGAPK